MTDLKKFDRVQIIAGPPDKVGLVGTVAILAVNGAIVDLGDGWSTPVKREHLKILPDHGPESHCPIENCAECDRISLQTEDL